MKFGITEEFDCNYLADKSERLLVCVEPNEKLADIYNELSKVGFRRSGDQIYRPHCIGCNACHSIRLPASAFTPSKSQKRVLSKNKDLTVVQSRQSKPDYYPLFARYIDQMHADGSMSPASIQQYSAFIQSSWASSLFLEVWRDSLPLSQGDSQQQDVPKQKLIAVAVMDILSDGLSALYTFFCPDELKRSLGTFMIMQQINLVQQQNQPYLYLGYQIDECRKMNYKTKFYPHERFFDEKWHFYANK